MWIVTNSKEVLSEQDKTSVIEQQPSFCDRVYSNTLIGARLMHGGDS